MQVDHFKKAKELINIITDKGYQAYIVGGAVRDHFLGHQINDIDIATSATPYQIQAIFEKVIPVGIKHGTVIVRYKGESFEVTTFRSESGYSDYRRPDHVSFVDSIDIDLSRRDFTINAMALTSTDHLIDPYKGKHDLDQYTIRAVGSPNQRFTEDPLRILRALRFASQLNFRFDEYTYTAIKRLINMVEKLSIERVTVELTKLFNGDYVDYGLKCCFDVHLFSHLPIFQDHSDIVDKLKSINKPFKHLIDVIVFLNRTSPQSPSITTWTKAYRLSNRALNNAKHLSYLVNLFEGEGWSNWLIYQLPENLEQRFIRLIEALAYECIDRKRVQVLRRSIPIANQKDIKISGSDLIKWYPLRERGPWIHDYLKDIERAVVEAKVTNQIKEIKEWVLKCHPPEKN
ncbi:CCA tRNA nucleotidyltransferase [Amphibacillus jilinensis]|uniref:CCA tRNA nucleotidyltransferase n=1 Tax=Amphibacillus jilinensis TaxID=1216008 RepID=UPI00030FEF49|nr:CCA tRNA nucleotidyltransferase [Amphibacillus jilinensis]